MLDQGRFLWMRLEDGESVIRLRGGTREGFKSNRPHAGFWGAETAYVLVPRTSIRAVNAGVKRALDFEAGLQNRSSDAEVLLLGTYEQIDRLITQGPLFCRARRKVSPSTEHIAGFRFTAKNGDLAGVPSIETPEDDAQGVG